MLKEKVQELQVELQKVKQSERVGASILLIESLQ